MKLYVCFLGLLFIPSSDRPPWCSCCRHQDLKDQVALQTERTTTGGVQLRITDAGFVPQYFVCHLPVPEGCFVTFHLT